MEIGGEELDKFTKFDLTGQREFCNVTNEEWAAATNPPNATLLLRLIQLNRCPAYTLKVKLYNAFIFFISFFVYPWSLYQQKGVQTQPNQTRFDQIIPNLTKPIQSKIYNFELN